MLDTVIAVCCLPGASVSSSLAGCQMNYLNPSSVSSYQKSYQSLNVVVCCRALVELALRDIDRFQRQKVKDLKDVFTNYAILQTEKYKKV